jgi:two-component system CheB/CheR fusion protein
MTGPNRQRLLDLLQEQQGEHALVLLDADAKVVAWMMGAGNVLGATEEQVLGQPLDVFFTPEDQAAGVPQSEVQNAQSVGVGEDDRWMVRRDGGRFWASGVLYCLRERDGTIAGYAKLLRDRTDQRGQVETLRNRAESLADEDRRKVVLLGTLAHELRNPLGAITNAVQLIDLAYPADSKLAYALQVLKRQTKYVTALIDDLLDVVRARTGKTLLDLQQVELAEIIADAREAIEGKAVERQQKVEVLLPPAPIRLVADRVRLTQVLVNLLSNASKFSAVGATLWIRGTVEADEAVVRVEDRGRGIAPALLPHVFDLLSQAHHERSGDGLGLGLSIVKEYVELHGGTVQVRSEGLGHGSEFAVRLPLKARAPP